MAAWRPFAHTRPAAALTLGLLVCGGTLFLLRAFPETAAMLDRVDLAWHDRMVWGERAGWVALARFLEVIGGAWVTVPFRIVVAVALWLRGQRGRFRLWVVAIVSAQALAVLFKALYARPRPFDRLSETALAAFPSGHTTQAAVIAFGLLLVLTPPGRTRLRWGIVALGWVLLVAWSRTYLRDHWLADVVGGALLGITCALAAGLLVQRRSTGLNRCEGAPARPGGAA